MHFNVCVHVSAASTKAWRHGSFNGSEKETLMQEHFYTLDDICQRTRLTRSGMYLQIKNGFFPRQIKWGRMSRWIADEVQQVFNARAAGKSDNEVRELVKKLHASRTEAQGVA